MDAFNFHLTEILFSRREFLDGDTNVRSDEKNQENSCSAYQDLCFVTVLENFIQSAKQMQQTVLFPSILMDLPVKLLLPDSDHHEIYLNRETDLRTFYLTVKSFVTQLTEGCNYIEEGLDEGIESMKNVRELCMQLRPLINQAKYLGYAAEEIALSLSPASFQEFTEHKTENAFLYDDHATCNLRAALKLFLHEMDVMEKETLLPNLLKSYRAVDYGFRSTGEKTLNDIYTSLLYFKSILVHSQVNQLESVDHLALHHTVSKLKYVFYNYAHVLNKLVLLYRQKVQEEGSENMRNQHTA